MIMPKRCIPANQTCIQVASKYQKGYNRSAALAGQHATLQSVYYNCCKAAGIRDELTQIRESY
jgi:hypothetical protein